MPHFFAQPPERNAEVDFFPAANFYFVGQRAKSLQPVCLCPARGEDDDGRKTVLEYFRAGIDRTRAADNHAQIIFRQTAFEPLSPELCRAGSHGDGGRINSARTGHHRVRCGAQFQQMLAITRAAK